MKFFIISSGIILSRYSFVSEEVNPIEGKATRLIPITANADSPAKYFNKLNLQIIQWQSGYIFRREFFSVRTTALILMCNVRTLSRIPVLFMARSTICDFMPCWCGIHIPVESFDSLPDSELVPGATQAMFFHRDYLLISHQP